MKKFFYFYAAIIAVIACSKMESGQNTVTDESPDEVQTITLGLEMPAEPVTKMNLEHDATSLRMKWTAGDVLQIGFRQESQDSPGSFNRGTVSVSVESANIVTESDGRRLSKVSVPVAGGIDTSRPYNLYIIYGPSGSLVSDVNNYNAYSIQLPSSASLFSAGSGNYSSLDHFNGINLPIIYSIVEISPDQTDFFAQMWHLGSFFVLHLRNDNSAWTSNYWVKLEDVSSWNAANTTGYLWNNSLPDGSRNHASAKFLLEGEVAMPASTVFGNIQFSESYSDFLRQYLLPLQYL